LKFAQNFVVQTSEDLRMRLWDIRESKVSLSTTVATGDNFATCLDFCHDRGFVVTGHRGFNEDGCDSKVWDFRKIKEPLVVLREHSEAVQGVKFVDGKIVSCGKDGKIVVFNKRFQKEGEWVQKNRKPFCCLDRFKGGVLAASVEPRVGFFKLEPLIQEM
jgi:WD40 repeat protein